MNFTKSKIFLICCLSFIVGIALASFLPIQLAHHDLWWFGGAIGCVAAVILFWRRKNEGVPVAPGRLHFLFLIGLFLFLGLWRYVISLPANTPDKIWYYNSQTVTVVGVVSNEPDIRQTNQKLEISIKGKKLDRFKNGSVPLIIKGKILVTTNLYPTYNYGDELKMTCKLQAPAKFQGFAYDRYLARYDIYSVCYYPIIEVIDTGKGNWLHKNVFNFKNKLRKIINYGLIEPESSLARAIILGDKKGISSDLRKKFSQAGISHIVAISGVHISILVVLVMSLLLGIGLPRQKAFWLASLFLLFYIILIGLPASAIRAGLMGFLVLWAMNLGRLNRLANSLMLTAAVLLLIKPKLLRDDIGFQLSFLAVLGIAYCYPILDDYVKSHLEVLKPLNGLKVVFDIFNITIAVQIFTIPIIAYNFSQVSIIAPISNLLILWTLPILIIASLVALGLSSILPSVAFLFFLPVWLLLKYIIIVAEWITKLPHIYAEINPEHLGWQWWMLVYYGVVWCFILKTRKSIRN